MVRGLERRAIFKDDTDCADFACRLAATAEAKAFQICGGALRCNTPTFAQALALAIRTRLSIARYP
jgi:hypothetical protein